MKPVVSIIVPVYNVEKYLKRCINSILAQEYTDFELILCNDGSTDESGSICDKYAAEDKRIKVIHKKNGGVSQTRNTALDTASGKYIQFVDSDDWLTPNATGILVHTAESCQCDMVIADFYRVFGDRLAQKGDIEDESLMTREDFAGHMMENPADFYYGVLWNKLYRRDIIEENHIRMDESISWCEDFIFNLEYVLRAQRFVAVQVPIYYYIKRKGSLASQCTNLSKTLKMKLNVFEYYNNFYKHIFDEKDYEKNRLQVYRFLLDAAGDGTVPPPIFPSSKKLGEERISLSQDAISGQGPLMDEFRRRKLLEYCTETICQKYSISFGEVKLLYHLANPHPDLSRKELADLLDISRSALMLSIQKLTSQGYIRTEDTKNIKSSANEEENEIKPDKKLKIVLLSQSKQLVSEINAAFRQYEHSVLSGFTEIELLELSIMRDKVKNNIQKVLPVNYID